MYVKLLPRNTSTSVVSRLSPSLRLSSGYVLRTVLLFLQSLLPENSPAGPEERIEEMQGGNQGVRGVPVSQELHPLPVHQVPRHRDEAGAAEGEEK